jgi:hypothetical protein
MWKLLDVAETLGFTGPAPSAGRLGLTGSASVFWFGVKRAKVISALVNLLMG